MNWARLLPPSGEEGIVTWRWTIAAAVLLLIVNGLSGRGWVIPFGDYAYAEEVAQQGEKIDRILTLQIASTLRALKKDECEANGNRSIIQATIEDYQQQYMNITGQRYPLPSCEGHP